MPFGDIIVPELLPPSEDGVFKTLMTHPDAKPVLRDENERARFRARRKFQMDMEHSLIVARDEGILSVARNALRKNMSIDDIIDITGLAREEVEALRVSV